MKIEKATKAMIVDEREFETPTVKLALERRIGSLSASEGLS